MSVGRLMAVADWQVRGQGCDSNVVVGWDVSWRAEGRGFRGVCKSGMTPALRRREGEGSSNTGSLTLTAADGGCRTDPVVVGRPHLTGGKMSGVSGATKAWWADGLRAESVAIIAHLQLWGRQVKGGLE